MTSAWVTIGTFQTEIHFRYAPAVVAFIKDTVPPRYRSYDPASKTWTVPNDFADPILARLRRAFGFHQVQLIDHSDTATAAGQPIAEWASQLFTALPTHLREPVYRALVKILHPDIGGDGRMAQQLNDAYQVYRHAS